MKGVFSVLQGHLELVGNVRILHGVEEGSPEISRTTAGGLSFVKNVMEPKLSTVQARQDVSCLAGFCCCLVVFYYWAVELPEAVAACVASTLATENSHSLPSLSFLL